MLCINLLSQCLALYGFSLQEMGADQRVVVDLWQGTGGAPFWVCVGGSWRYGLGVCLLPYLFLPGTVPLLFF